MDPRQAYDELQDYFTQIQSLPGGMGRFWQALRDRQLIEHIRGISRASIQNLNTDLERLVSKDNAKQELPPRDTDKLQRLFQACAAYLQSQPTPALDEVKSRFVNQVWYLYFFYNYKRTHLGLARVVLRIDAHGTVYLDNLPDQNSEHYTGTFDITYEKYGTFNLYGIYRHPKRLFL